jgi:hypothetical protein
MLMSRFKDDIQILINYVLLIVNQLWMKTSKVCDFFWNVVKSDYIYVVCFKAESIQDDIYGKQHWNYFSFPKSNFSLTQCKCQKLISGGPGN